VFGPKPRDYTKKVSKSTRRLAFQKALSERINAGDVLTVDKATLQIVAADDLIQTVHLWNDATDTEVSNPTKSVTVHLGSVHHSVVVYDPLLGTTPIATYTDVQDFNIPVGDHPLVIEIDRTSKPYDDFQKWCREIVWWGNKKGAYLYSPNATAITPELAGHY